MIKLIDVTQLEGLAHFEMGAVASLPIYFRGED
jgi:hypothetical protein